MASEPADPREPLVLFGGTFDPVHNGHLIVARALAEAAGFRRIHLLPAGTPPHKADPRTDAAIRLHMLEAAVAGDETLVIRTDELHRRGPSYTFDTVWALRREQADLDVVLAVGADMFADLPNWRRAAELLPLVRFAVAARPPWPQRMPLVWADLRDRFGPHFDHLRAEVHPTPLLEISSSDIRRRVGQGRSIRYLVPEPVERIIRERGLYRRPMS